jgi:hypothetical protein
MPDFRRIGAIALVTAIALQLFPPKVNAQAVFGVPIVETIVIVGAAGAVTTLYVWYVNGIRHESSTYPMLEDPEGEGEWGEFKAGDDRKCQRLAAGRDWYWEDGKCFIKV